MDDDERDEEEDLIMVVVKSAAGDEWDALVDRAGDVGAMKDAIAEQHELAAEQMRLIYRGKILANHATLKELAVEEGHAVHMVIDKKPAPTAQPVVVDDSTISVPGLGSVNKDMLQSMANNPMMEWLASNPEMMKDMMINSNPRLKAAMERDPQVAQMLNDPATTKQMIDMIRNPALLQQMSQSMDRQITQIQNIPGGYQHIERFVNSMDSALDTPDAPEASSSGPAVPDGVPLPSPWDPAPAPAAAAAAPASSAPASGAGWGANPAHPNPFAAFAPASTSTAPSSAGDYSSQLEQMQSMGFSDRQANLAALRLANGNVDFAIAHLLNQQS